MRVALLASSFALLAGSPAFSQCVYVACNGGGPVYQQPSHQQPVYQQPSYLAPTPAPSTTPTYDDGYAAGLAARPASRPTTQATPTRSTHRAAMRPVASQPKSIYGRSAATRNGGTSSTARRHVGVQRAPTAARQATSVHRAPSRLGQIRSTTNAHQATRHRTYTVANGGNFRDPIKDRAATYRPSVYGQSTTMASMMSQSGMSSSSSYSQSTTTWSGPMSTVSQGGQVCGWGARIVTNSHGQAQRQAVWVCQCPQGWRPPGY